MRELNNNIKPSPIIPIQPYHTLKQPQPMVFKIDQYGRRIPIYKYIYSNL